MPDLLRENGPARRYVFRCSEATAGRLGPAFGLTFPLQPCHTSSNAIDSLLWLGPDEWLVLTDRLDAPALAAQALAGEPYALTEITDRQVAIRISGAGAAETLNSECPLDLGPAAFPVGSATRTVMGKAEIVLWRKAQDDFHLEVWRSFAAYVSALLEEARADTQAGA